MLSLAASSGTAAPKPFRVTSTIDGKTVLPHHLRWIGATTLPAPRVAKVEFLIDGKVRWIETDPPFVYAGDENGAKLGYLVTSWLTPGNHVFEVRAHASSGKTASDRVIARVLPAAEVPAALAGTWHRTLAKGLPADPGASGNQPTPAGTYRLTFERRWMQDRFPGTFKASNALCFGCILHDDYVVGPTTFTVWGGVQTLDDSEWGAAGGWWCDSSGPPATYSWSVSGDTLTLAPVGGKDACNQRGMTWTGRWARVR